MSWQFCGLRLRSISLGIGISFFLTACQSLSPTAVPPAPQTVSSSERSSIQTSFETEIETKLDELLSDRFSDQAPGAAILVTAAGETVYAKGWGLSNVEQQQRVTTRTVFDLASVSKSMTALAVLRLQEQGLLNLEDSVVQHLPNFRDPNPETPILISHLLYHTSGLADYISDWDWDNNAEAFPLLDLQGHLQWLNQQESKAEPGAEYRYSDTGYALLALVVERVANQPFPQLMQEQFFEPVGMTQTQLFQDLESTFPQQAQGYKTETQDTEPRIEPVSYPVLMLGDGNVFTSIEDLARYDQALRQGQLVSEQTLALMFQTGTLNGGQPIENSQGEGYGAGWNLASDYAHHEGGWAGMRSYYRFYTQRPVSIVILSNNENLDVQALGEAIAEVITPLPLQ